MGQQHPHRLERSLSAPSAPGLGVFSLLPGNYGPDAPFSYEGPTEARGWRYDRPVRRRIQHAVPDQQPLVANMVNDLLNHQDQPYLPHLIGVRMHVLADTWAHTYLCRHAVVGA